MAKFKKEMELHHIKLDFSAEQMEWIKGASKLLELTPKTLVTNLFWEQFRLLSEELAKETKKEMT